MALSKGQQFAGYKIVRLLGSGGMGEVYLAQHPRLPRHDALKILPIDLSSNAEYRARFAREADLASTLWHPHIVGVHDRGEADGQLWISMDFVDGHDAARVVAEASPDGMPVADVATVIAAVASALDYAHKKGLLHRDVKPANIMLAQDHDDRRILLADFGIARDINDIDGITATNATLGTMAYCAPEQLMGKSMDGRADQYALAATAYHLLTGETLFPHTNPAVVISHHLNADPPSLAASHPDLAAFDPVLAAALAKHPESRFARCSDFAQAFNDVAGLGRPSAPPTTPAPVTRRQPAPPKVSAPGATSKNAASAAATKASAPKQTTIENAATGGHRRNRIAVIAATVLSAAALVAVAALFLLHPWDRVDSTATSNTTSPPSAQSPSTPTLQPSTPPVPLPKAPAPAPIDPYRYLLPGACYSTNDPPTERPKSLIFETCADGTQRLESLSWSSWGKGGAQGEGILSLTICEPNCAAGPRVQYAIDISASNPTPATYNSGCPTDWKFYGELVISFPAASPDASVFRVDSTYQGRPAIRLTPTADGTGQGSLDNQNCY